MSDLHELYQQVIIDHGRAPRNFGHLAEATSTQEGYNPLCGDRLIVYMQRTGEYVQAIRFEGSGCAISMASASLMTEVLQGKTVGEIEKLFQEVHTLLTTGTMTISDRTLGKLMVLAGVAQYPMRVKCATLCWHTAMAALHHQKDCVSTE